jgi:hypothetical protein
MKMDIILQEGPEGLEAFQRPGALRLRQAAERGGAHGLGDSSGSQRRVWESDYETLDF